MSVSLQSPSSLPLPHCQSPAGVYWSRKRGLWHKGLTSGDTQSLQRIQLDCDRDALVFVVQQHGRGFCHRGVHACTGPMQGIAHLERVLTERKAAAPEGSYTKRLFEDPSLLKNKLIEEAIELSEVSLTLAALRDSAWVIDCVC